MNSTFKNLIWYTIPFLFRNLIPLISLPFFTRYLSPFDFGNLALSVIYAVFLVALLNLGLIYVFERNYFEYEKDGEKLKLLWSCVIFVFINLTIGIIVTFNYEEQINYYLFSKSLPIHLTVFATIHLGVKSLLQFFYIYLRNAKKAFIYSLISIFEALICTFSSVYLVFYKKGILGYVQGQCIGVFVLFVAIMLFSIFRRNIYFSFFLLKQNLSLSFPLTPRVFFGAINTQFDRYMLGVLNTRGGVGIYDIGQKIANFGFLSMTVMQHVFAPEVISTYVNKPKDFSNHIGQYLAPFFYVSTFICLLLGLFSKEMVFLLTTPEYYEAYQIIIILNMLYATYFFGKQRQLILAKKTKLISILSFVSIILNIVINYPLIKIYGIVGAALGTLFSGLIMAIISFYYAQKFCKISYNKAVYFIYGLFQISMLLILYLSTFQVFSYISLLLVKLCIIILFIWLGFKLKIIDKKFIKTIKLRRDV